MRVARSSDSVLIIFDAEENKVVDWIFQTGSTKFKEIIEMYIKQRKNAMDAYVERDIMNGIKSMSQSDRDQLLLDVVVKRKDR